MNVSLREFIIVQTLKGTLTQKYMVQPTTHLGQMVQPNALGCKPVDHITVLNTVGNDKYFYVST